MRAWLIGVVLMAVLAQLVVTAPVGDSELDRNKLLDYLLQAYSEDAYMQSM